jgi:hypothetical protein
MGPNTTQGTGAQVLGDVDLLSTDDLRRMAEVPGPCVTVYLPSTHSGPGTRSGPSRLHRLATEAATRLRQDGLGPAEADEVVAPLRALENDLDFWQHQGEGLALFAAPGFFEGYRLAAAPPEQVHVGDSVRLLPLLSELGGETTFYILALSQNSVRLFLASEHTVGQLDLPDLPRSMESAVPEAEAERVRGVHSVGSSGAVTHGQGTEADYDKRALERYFRVVDDALLAHLADGPRPLVLACVEYYVPMYRAASRYPAIWEQAVHGSPERRSAQELHAAAWPLVADHFAEEGRAELARFRQTAGTGRTAAGTQEVLAAARTGSVDTLLVDPVAAAASVDDALEQAVAETLRRSGRVLTVAPEAALGAPAAAMLRY